MLTWHNSGTSQAFRKPSQKTNKRKLISKSSTEGPSSSAGPRKVKRARTRLTRNRRDETTNCSCSCATEEFKQQRKNCSIIDEEASMTLRASHTIMSRHEITSGLGWIFDDNGIPYHRFPRLVVHRYCRKLTLASSSCAYQDSSQNQTTEMNNRPVAQKYHILEHKNPIGCTSNAKIGAHECRSGT